MADAAAEIARLEKQSQRLNDDRNEIRRELRGVQIKADALADAARTVVAIHEHMVAGEGVETASLKQAMAALRVRLTDYQGEGK